MNARNLWPIRVLAPLSLAIAVLTGCSPTGAPEGATAVAEVTVAKVTRVDLTRTVTASGTIAALPGHDVKVSALVAGRITALEVAEGDAVRGGQLLARLDDAPYRDQLRQAEAAAAQARAQLDNARAHRDRSEDLVQRGIAARKEAEDADTEEHVAEAGLQQAEAALSLAQAQLARAELHSPLDGTVVKRFTSAGEQVDGTAGQPVVEVADLGEVELLASVPAEHLGALTVGEALLLSGAAATGERVEGRIVAISQAVDQVSNAGLVRVRFANREGRLRLGMFVTAEIPVESHRGVLAVPREAVYLDQEGQRHVYRLNGDTVTAAPVEVGLESGDLVELRSGPAEGDTVVLTGGYGLADGAKVRVKDAAQP